MIEDQLRASFARHEDLVPQAQDLTGKIDAGARRMRRTRATVTSSLAALAVFAAIAVPVLGPRLAGMVNTAKIAAGAKSTTPNHASVTGPLNFLVLGLDRRPTQPTSEPARADTIMIMHLPAGLERGYLFSVPRDLLVEIPGRGKDKINAAYAYGGKDLAKRTVEQLTGLSFDGTAEVRFEGLSRLTDALGGVPMCIDQKVVSIHTKKVFDPQCQRFTGADALDFLRQRYTLPGGTIDRDRHARQFVSALLDEAGNADLMSDPAKLTKVIRATGDAMTLDLDRIGLLDLAWAVRGLRAENLTGDEVPTTSGTYHGSAVEIATPKAAVLFEALRNDNASGWVAGK